MTIEIRYSTVDNNRYEFREKETGIITSFTSFASQAEHHAKIYEEYLKLLEVHDRIKLEIAIGKLEK